MNIMCTCSTLGNTLLEQNRTSSRHFTFIRQSARSLNRPNWQSKQLKLEGSLLPVVHLPSLLEGLWLYHCLLTLHVHWRALGRSHTYWEVCWWQGELQLKVSGVERSEGPGRGHWALQVPQSLLWWEAWWSLGHGAQPCHCCFHCGFLHWLCRIPSPDRWTGGHPAKAKKNVKTGTSYFYKTYAFLKWRHYLLFMSLSLTSIKKI